MIDQARAITRPTWTALTVVAVIVGAGIATTAQAAARRPTYCESTAKAAKAVRVAVSGRTVLLRERSNFMLLCSDRRRKAVEVTSSAGGALARFVAVDSQCAVILTTKRGKLPELVSVDLKTAFRASHATAGVIPIGFGNPSATVVSLVMSSNCIAASGAVVDTGGGTLDRRIDTVQVLKGGAHTVFASGIPTTADLKRLSIRAQGRGALVSWTENGAPKSQPLAG